MSKTRWWLVLVKVMNQLEEYLSYLSQQGDQPYKSHSMSKGDFNVLFDPSESSDFTGDKNLSNDIKDFRDCVGELDVHDHPYNGPFFTWSNHQEDNPLARRLDPALVCSTWHLFFPRSMVEFVSPHVSDHCPILINLDRLEFSPPKPLKFFICWTKHPNFLTIVEDSWNEDVVVDP
ncbi:hypothetical protein ES332_D11G041400v1 [Gossypium tomentosum]|uniref:Endonuclease/exonuclease/phosphatase domain-containing protein n=1 Tax=Gossypium tomentosum TaxID=34277 RepID=A0A5D2IHQ3_GOSTO|nr:hypothetical protein ES332_D11G041400v1 [Gossypium tomentosum]